MRADDRRRPAADRLQRMIEQARPLYHSRDFRILIVLNLLLGFSYSFIGPFISIFGTIEVGMSAFEFGIFMTVTALGGIVAGTWLARYSDTSASRRSMLLLGGIMGMAGYAGYAFVREFWPLLLIGTLVLGVSSITFSQLFAHARELLGRSDIPEEQNAFYMNVFRMFFALSWTIGPAIASWVLTATSFHGLFLTASAFFGSFVVMVWRYVPAVEYAQPRTGPEAGSIRRVLRRPDVAAHFAAFIAVFAASTIGTMNLPLLVLNDLGGTEGNVGIIYSIAPIFELPLMLYFGLLATRHHPARIIRIGIAILVVYFGALTLVQAPWHIYPLQALMAAATAVTSGVAITYFQNYLPNHAGSATNIYVVASRVGQTAGYFVFGALVERFGHRTTFVACAVLTFVSLALMSIRIRPETISEDVEVEGPVRIAGPGRTRGK